MTPLPNHRIPSIWTNTQSPATHRISPSTREPMNVYRHSTSTCRANAAAINVWTHRVDASVTIANQSMSFRTSAISAKGHNLNAIQNFHKSATQIGRNMISSCHSHRPSTIEASIVCEYFSISPIRISHRRIFQIFDSPILVRCGKHCWRFWAIPITMCGMHVSISERISMWNMTILTMIVTYCFRQYSAANWQ